MRLSYIHQAKSGVALNPDISIPRASSYPQDFVSITQIKHKMHFY